MGKPEDKIRWRTIPGVKNYYLVSNRGAVKSLSHSTQDKRGIAHSYAERVLHPFPGNRSGHLQVEVKLNSGIPKKIGVHVLVLRAFVGMPKKGQVCRHLDGDPAHNFLSNLKWGTSQENSQDMVRHGRATQHLKFFTEKKNARCKLSDKQVYKIITQIDSGISAKILAENFGVNSALITALSRGSRRNQVFLNWVKDHGRVPKRAGWTCGLTTKDINLLCKLRKEGVTAKDLALRFKVTVTTINDHLRKRKAAR